MKHIYILLIISLSMAGITFGQKGRIEGRVFNVKNNEPLPLSNILIRGTKTGTTSDFDGKFVITNVDPGFVELEVSSLGYNAVVTEEIQVIPGKVSSIDVALNEVNLEISTVNVTAQRFKKKDESPVSLRSITISEIENSAGVNRDIAKVVQSLPGVAALPGANRNDIIVRGGASNESRFFLDDVEIPNINHFATQGASGGSNGILNADFIREVEFYSGAFPANRGNALSGVFNFKQIDGNKERLKFRTTLGASELSLTMDGPLSEKTTFIVSARRSYLQFLFKAIGLPFLPTFNDYQIKTRTRLDEKNEITVVSVGALDQFKLDTDLKNPTENQQYILNFLPVYEQWNYTLGVVYKHFREKGFSTLVASRNMLNNRSFKYYNNIETDENRILDYTSQEIENRLRAENNVKFENGVKLQYGVGMEYVKYNNSTFQKISLPSGLDTIQYNSALEFFKFSSFIQATRSFLSGRLTASAGLRFDGNNYADQMLNPLPQTSPRVSLSYALTEKISINANSGRYYQHPAYTTLGYRDSEGKLANQTADLKYISADHFIGGLEYRPGNNSRITAEGFYKLYNRYPFSVRDSISLANRPVDFGVVGDEAVTSTGKGRAYGVEFLWQAKIKEKTNVTVSYTYAISEFTDKYGDYVPSSWDNRHIFIASVSHKFGKNWNAAAKWRFAGGLPYTPYDLDRSSQISAWNVSGRPYADFENVNGERFIPFHQLDLRVDRSIYFKKASMKIYLDIQNAYNFKSQELDRVTNLNESGQPVVDPSDPSRYLLRSIPSDGSGTILPTIGVILDF